MNDNPNWVHKPNWLHFVTLVPTLIMLMWGIAIGILLGPFAYGLKIGFDIIDDFWGPRPNRHGEEET